MAIKDISGQKYGRLIAIKQVGKDGRHVLWLFKCDCGNETITRATSVRSGNTKSCGCLRSQISAERMLKNRIGIRYGR